MALLLSSTWLSPHPSSQGSTTLLRERVVVQYLSTPTLVSKGLESLPLCCDRKKPPFASLLPPRFGALRESQIQQSLKPDWGMMLQSPVWWVHLQCPPPPGSSYLAGFPLGMPRCFCFLGKRAGLHCPAQSHSCRGVGACSGLLMTEQQSVTERTPRAGDLHSSHHLSILLAFLECISSIGVEVRGGEGLSG